MQATNNEHKFKIGSGNNGTYQTIIYCEYCGHIAFYANHSNNEDAQKMAKEKCPRTPLAKDDKEEK